LPPWQFFTQPLYGPEDLRLPDSENTVFFAEENRIAEIISKL
jgi:hypothetical protein